MGGTEYGGQVSVFRTVLFICVAKCTSTLHSCLLLGGGWVGGGGGWGGGGGGGVGGAEDEHVRGVVAEGDAVFFEGDDDAAT